MRVVFDAWVLAYLIAAGLPGRASADPFVLSDPRLDPSWGGQPGQPIAASAPRKAESESELPGDVVGKARNAAYLEALRGSRQTLDEAAACHFYASAGRTYVPPDHAQSDAFASDRRGCMAEAGRRLQPVADRINAPGTPPSAIAANNAGLQADHDGGFTGCMAARGNLPDRAPVRSAAFPAPAPWAGSGTSDDAAGTLPGGWRLLRLIYHGTGRPKDVNDELWRREITNLPAGLGGQLPIYEVSFPDGSTTVLLSIAGQGGPACDNGSNDINSTRDYAVCPGKLVLLQDGRPVATRSVGRTCAEVINEGGVRPGAPGWQDPRLWGTRARYAAAAGTIELVTLQQGRPERACTKTLQVR